MPYISAVVFLRWKKDQDDANVPDAIDDVYAWAIANGEQLPDGSFGKYSDVTGQSNVHQRILDNLGVFAAKLEITVATAQQFAADNRFWTLGLKRYDNDGEVLASNWDDVLTTQERQQAVNYITNNSNITAQQLGNRFDATDTRREIAQKLKELFRE